MNRAIYKGLGMVKSPGYLVSINGHKGQGLVNWGGMNGAIQIERSGN